MRQLIFVSITGLNPTFEHTEISPNVGMNVTDHMKELIKTQVNLFLVTLKHKVYN
jgi:hypothetical protein